MNDTKNHSEQEICDWWATDIINMSPGKIAYHGYAIEDLIGNLTFSQMIWLMLRGEIPSPEKSALLDAVLMAAVDHGPQAPSIAIARMAATCGVGINNAMASALNVLGDVHGGAGEQALNLYQKIAEQAAGSDLEQATKKCLTELFSHGKYVPGFGHRFHPIDPRAPKLLALAEKAAKDNIISGQFIDIARQVESQIKAIKGKLIPMNIDGATAAIYAELGFNGSEARGLFCLSRSVGILSHAVEQSIKPERNKGPMPKRMIWSYTGKEDRQYQPFK